MSRLGKLLRYASLVRKQTGKTYFRQLAEIVRLAAGAQRLGIAEYYELEVFADTSYPGLEKLDCVGWRASAEIDKTLNDDYWRATANDKVLNYALLEQYGFPIPETFATYSPNNRGVGREKTLNNEEALRAFLRNDIHFPVFIKPIHGSYGRGTFLLRSYEASIDSFVDAQGEKIQIEELVGTCLKKQFNGMLFQECLQPHDEVRALVGNTTSCVRVIVALAAGGAKIHMAFWKIARAHNITDNFCMGESGNLLAWVNIDSGTIERVVTGLWPDGSEVSEHPDTKQELLGRKLPNWRQAMEMCLSVAPHFPGLKLQHWDVAFCRQGPVLMELNTEADLGVPQFLGRTPFIDKSISAMMKDAHR